MFKITKATSFRKMKINVDAHKSEKILMTIVSEDEISAGFLEFSTLGMVKNIYPGDVIYDVDKPKLPKNLFLLTKFKQKDFIEIELNAPGSISFLTADAKKDLINGLSHALKPGFNSIRIPSRHKDLMIKIECPQSCHYKMTIIQPNMINKLTMDKLKQGMLPLGSDPLKYRFQTTGKDTHLDIRLRIVRTYNNKNQYVPFYLDDVISHKIVNEADAFPPLLNSSL